MSVNRRRKYVLVGTVIVVLTSTAAAFVVIYALRSSSQDHSTNWQHAFGETIPKGIHVLQSHYVETGHWSGEYEYFFEIEVGEELLQQIITSRKMHTLDDPTEAKHATEGPFVLSEKPVWFLPKRSNHYEVWVEPEYSWGCFRLIIDETNGHVFLTECRI